MFCYYSAYGTAVTIAVYTALHKIRRMGLGVGQLRFYVLNASLAAVVRRWRNARSLSGRTD
ncbi:hypothetical protein N7519_007967 [Penicillium mononematosum]|uniref:uncharacterized protein n=1 Tax=Penicillium mononematosum TaxID=268346 RepID=UPI0025471265|nr:uncharacterized protein N7519_007967 [Penicillium mononematosum]KAJ6186666.1 hypothetical protein N7519_007967 [Penicillium mononematosum]